MIQATVRATIFVRAIEEHVLRAQYNGRQDRKIHFYWHMAWQYLIWPQFTDVLLKLLVTCTVFILKKKETEAAIVSGVAKPSPAPELTALNIFNAIKL